MMHTVVYGVTYTSAGVGPSPWNVSTSWSPAGIPTSTDDVIIATGHTITITAVGNKCRHLTIDGTMSFTTNVAMVVYGNYVISASGSELNKGTIQFNPPGTTITVNGISSNQVYYAFYSNRTITAGSVIDKSNTTTLINTNFTLTNLGSYITGVMNTKAGSSWINGTGSTVTITRISFMAGRTFTANATGNTVILSYINGEIPLTTSGYYNLTVGYSGTKILQANTVVGNTLTISSGSILSSNNFDLVVGGNWVNSGTFSPGTRNVTFNGTSVISGSGVNSFYDLTITGSLTGSSGTMTFSHDFINNGTYLNNNGTIIFNGTSVISGSTITNFRNITISGVLTANPAGMNVSRNWVNNGTFNHNNGTVTFNGNTFITGSAVTQFNNVTITGTLISHPTLGLTVSGNWTNNGAFTHNNSGVTFNGTTLITGSATTSFNNVTINGTLTGHASTTNVAGNFVNNGTYASNSGLIVFNGAVTQSISGIGTGAFESLTLSNANGLAINGGTYTLGGILTITAGQLANNTGTFTLTSDASRYARIAPISLGCGSCGFSGNFIIQRYIPNRSIGTWADLSSPVSNSTMQDWDDELFLVYPFLGFNDVTNRPTGTNVMAYDEVSASYYELNTATPLAPGQGFEIGLTDDNTNTNFSNTTLTSQGTPNFGTVSIPLSFTGSNGPAYPVGYSGENLIGNPYASAISLDQITIVNALSTVDVYDYTIDNYKTLSGTDLIGPNQGFWAYAQGAGASFTMFETSKSNNTTTAVNRIDPNAELPYFTLTLSSADGSHTMEHTLKVACNENASDGWDVTDHPFRKSLNPKAPSITSYAENARVTINTFNNQHETYLMPLKVEVKQEGEYSIQLMSVNTVTRDFPMVFLEDRKTKQFIDVTKSSDYKFTTKEGDSDDRFVLHFSKSANYKPSVKANTSNEIVLLKNELGNEIKFNFKETENVTISMVDLLGKQIIADIQVKATEQTINIALPSTFQGVYLVIVHTSGNRIVKKFIAE